MTIQGPEPARVKRFDDNQSSNGNEGGSAMLDLAVVFGTEGFDGGRMGIKIILTIQKNCAKEADLAVSTLPFDRANFEN
jgi:hypothetical protein